MKKQIFITLALLLSISLIDARTQTRDGGNTDALLAQAALLDDYAQLSIEELKAGKGEEAWDIIGQLYDAMHSENGSVNAKVAQQIMQKIENYKQAENAKLAALRSKQIKG